MRILKISLYVLVALLLSANLAIFISGKTFIYKALRYNFVNIDDYKIFENRAIPKSNNPQPWPVSTNYNVYKLSDAIETTLTTLSAVAFLVIKDDSVQIEKYWNGYNGKSLSNSFSMAKSVISMLVGAALLEGKIKSIDQPVADFLSEFNEDKKKNITIKHLLMMSSGLDWDEAKGYNNPISVFFSDIMTGYYGEDLYKLVTSIPVAEKPGVFFDYKGGDTQLLAFILMKVTGKSISAYFSEKIWNKIGAENDALWSLDRKGGNEKAFCCLNSNARDFAKLGKLYLNNGNWNGKLLVDSIFVKESKMSTFLKDKVDSTRKVDYYGYQWWMLPEYKGQNIFYMRGTLGQFVIVIPKKKIIIVRLGEAQGGKRPGTDHYAQTYILVDEVNKIFK